MQAEEKRVIASSKTNQLAIPVIMANKTGNELFNGCNT